MTISILNNPAEIASADCVNLAMTEKGRAFCGGEDGYSKLVALLSVALALWTTRQRRIATGHT